MNTHKQSRLAYLSRLCLHWGGELVVLPEQAFQSLNYQSGISGAPDGWHAVDISHRRVITAQGHACPGCIIHEMGHLFLIEAEPEVQPDEWSWFGWEVALARQARCYPTWSKSSNTYIVGGRHEGREWGKLNSHERRYLITDRIAHAKAIGILSQDAIPLRTRD